VNLKNGKLGQAKPADYMTKRTACAPGTGEPRLWLEFLRRVTEGDEDLISYLQRFAGYSLTGETSEHALAFLYGTGANGKTTFLQTLMGIWQDYAVSAGFEVFADSKADRHPTEIARLRGARLVITEETDAGGRWNEGRIKRLTGGGKISAHFMRQDDFEFEPQFKLLIAGNHKPMIRSVDEAIKRRIHLVPFTVTIPPEERDKQLMAKLKTEWPQILHWAINGCLAWQDDSLSPGERIIAATEQYVESEDILGAWLDECCDRGGNWDGKALFENYRKWCDAQGENVWSRRAWSNAMLDRGFPQKRTASARRFQGISLKMQQQAGYEGELYT
jgi:putative DNA primase/helicase